MIALLIEDNIAYCIGGDNNNKLKCTKAEPNCSFEIGFRDMHKYVYVQSKFFT